MKRLLFLLAIVMSSQLSFAQTDFCVPGATWTYYGEYANYAASPQVQRHVVYLGDTAIATFENVKVLRTETRFRQSPSGTINSSVSFDYVRQSNDSIFRLLSNNWELIFDYGVEEGDSRIVHIGDIYNCETGTDTIVIDSVYQTLMVDTQLKTIDFTLQSSFFSDTYLVHGTFLERIGFLSEHCV